MKQYDHLSALQQLLNIDTTVFKDELYYPWYIKKPNIIALSLSWIAFIILSVILLAVLTTITFITLIAIAIVLTFLMILSYLLLIKTKLKEAKSSTLSQMMRLEKHGFIKGIQPFVPDEMQATAKRITHLKDFTPDEYSAVTLATQSRVLFNTDSFIQEIEALFSSPEYKVQPRVASDEYREITLKVPDNAKKNYEKLKNASTFYDIFSVPDEAKQAIIAKAHEAMNRAALGRDHFL